MECSCNLAVMQYSNWSWTATRCNPARSTSRVQLISSSRAVIICSVLDFKTTWSEIKSPQIKRQFETQPSQPFIAGHLLRLVASVVSCDDDETFRVNEGPSEREPFVGKGHGCEGVAAGNAQHLNDSSPVPRFLLHCL